MAVCCGWPSFDVALVRLSLWLRRVVFLQYCGQYVIPVCRLVHADIEASLADIVWPMSNTIVATAASHRSTLMAVALANSDIVVWNRDIGKYWQLILYIFNRITNNTIVISVNLGVQ